MALAASQASSGPSWVHVEPSSTAPGSAAPTSNRPKAHTTHPTWQNGEGRRGYKSLPATMASAPTVVMKPMSHREWRS